MALDERFPLLHTDGLGELSRFAFGLVAHGRRRRCLISFYCSPVRTIDDAARPADFPELGGQVPSKRGTEDGVRMMEGGRATPGIGEEHPQGRWSQVRPGLPFPEGERPAPGSRCKSLR
ncbi:hypothetical protein EVAR_13542_1 [Eumeta japonica]|uniref:Uncharacterized protein n=1 Tax=Eumeta variegata TaxID=151549 RepID=A0A4C1U8R7_EUMVA|nr:hypothetical protein EVAR_13542_1 [Eumeta japonica]